MSNIDLGTATGHIVLDASGVGSGINATQTALTSLNDVVRNNWWGLKNVGEQLLLLSTIAAGALGGAAAAAVQWQDAMAKIETQTFDTTKSNEQNAQALDKVSEGLKNLALNTSTPISNLAAIAQQAAALGIRSEDIVGFTKVINNLANTTDATAATSTQALGRLSTALGLSSEQVSRAGSVIFELSRKSPATATEIEQLSEKLVGLQSSAGLTAPQILAISAAVSSISPNVRTAATTVNTLFQQMSNSVRDGGDQLSRFAAITGQTTDQFATGFRTNASGALVQFLDGLNNARAQGLQLDLVLEGLGVSNVQQRETILALAQAQDGVGASTSRLSSELAVANDAWVQNTALTNAANRQYSTVGAQIAEMRNAIVEAAQAFGSTFLPVLKPVVIALTDVVIGIANLPGPLRIVVALFLTGIAVISAFGAAVFLLGPRIILAQDALRRLVDIWRQMQPEALAAAEATRLAEQATANAAAAADIYTLGLQNERAQLQLLYTQLVTVAGAQERLANLENSGTATAEELAIAELNLQRAQNQESIAADNATRAQERLNVARQQSVAVDAETVIAEEAVAGASAAAGGATAAAGAEGLAGAAGVNAMAGSTAGLTAETQGLTAATGEAAVGATELAGGLEVAGGAADATGVGLPIGAILGVAGAAVFAAGALGVFGSSQRKAATDSNANVSANQDLVRILQEQGSQLDTDARKWVVQQLAMSGALAESEKLKISTKDLFSVITGSASPQVAQDFVNAIQQAENAGDPAAKALGDAVHNLFLEFQLSAEAAREQTSANKDLGVSADGATGSVNGLGSSLEQTAQKSNQIAQAAVSYIDALFSLRSAINSVRDAEEQVASAREQQSGLLLDEQKNTLDLERAQLDEVKSNNDLVKASNDLATARQRASDATQKAQITLRDALERSTTAVERTTDAQTALNEAMRPAPALDLAQATNALADARLRLRDDTQSVSDAEWQLQFLQLEGASGRDIKDAQTALAKAKQQQVDDTTSAAKAQDELNKKQEGDPQKITSAQRQVRDALTSQRDAVESVTAAQKNLQQAQDDQATDKIFNDALLQQQQAQLSVANAAIQVQQAQNTVAQSSEKRTKAAEAVQKAEDSVTSALFQEAKAQTEVQKEAALAQGKQFDASNEAAALAANLINLGNTVGGPVGAQMVALGIQLSNTLDPKNYQMTDGTPTSIDPIDTSNATAAGQALNKLDEENNTHSKSSWDRIKHDAEEGVAFIFDIVTGRGPAAGIANAIGNFFDDPLPRIDAAWDHIHFSTVTGIGRVLFDTITGTSGVPDALLNGLTNFGNIFGDIYNAGSRVIAGFINGMIDTFNGGLQYIEGIPGKIVNVFFKHFKFGSPSKVTYQHGQWIIQGLIDGMLDQQPDLDKSLDNINTIFKKNPALMSDASLSGGSYVSPQAAQSSVPWSLASAIAPNTITHEGDQLHFHEVKPTAQEILSDINWQKRIKTRN